MCDFRIPKKYKGVEYPKYVGEKNPGLEDLKHPWKYDPYMFYSVAMTGSMLVFHDGKKFIDASRSEDVEFEKDDHSHCKLSF